MYVFSQFKFLVSVSIIIIINVQSYFAEDELRETHGKIIHSTVFFVHGARTPKYQDLKRDQSYWTGRWKQGKGVLTEDGKKQMTELGQWFRQRYHSLVQDERARANPASWPQMDSSDEKINQESARIFLGAFFQPEEIPSTLPIGWNNQKRIDFDPATCKRYKSEMDKLNESRVLKKLYRDYSGSFKEMAGLLEEGSPPKGDIVKAVKEAYYLYDTLVIENEVSADAGEYTLPDWATPALFPHPLHKIALHHLYVIAFNGVMRRLRSGPLIKEMIEDMERKISQENSAPSFHFYSGDDFTISCLLASLGSFVKIGEKPPPPGSSLIFELRRDIEGALRVTVSYRKEVFSEITVLTIPIENCGDRCTFDQFKSAMTPLMPTNWEKECSMKPEYPFGEDMLIPALTTDETDEND